MTTGTPIGTGDAEVHGGVGFEVAGTGGYVDPERFAQWRDGQPKRYAIAYRLNNRLGMTTTEPAEGAMHDWNVLIGMGATDINVVEVKA